MVSKIFSSTAKQPLHGPGLLDPRLFMEKLLADGHITSEVLETIIDNRRGKALHKIPLLAYIADQQVADLSNPGHVLDIEMLTHKLAEFSGQPYYRIDPLNMDAARTTQVMSLAFAERHKILAVEVNATEVVIASTEPFINAWEADLAQVTRKPIRRVLANPLEIQRLTTELYRLASSISFATSKSGSSKAPGLGNLEQMLELGRMKDPEANDQHVVHIVDWLLQYAFEQRASDIHIEPRRDIGNLRFRIDGVLYTVYQMPMQIRCMVYAALSITRKQ